MTEVTLGELEEMARISGEPIRYDIKNKIATLTLDRTFSAALAPKEE